VDNLLDVLYDYEAKVLLEALRRDLRNEQKHAAKDIMNAHYHLTNAHIIKRVLGMIETQLALGQGGKK